jgi:hypothetical protein
MDECYIVDTDTMTGEDLDLLEEPASDSELGELAKRAGKSIKKMGQDTGWGDNSYRFTVSYSPLSIKDEADAYIEGAVYTEGDSEYDALMWAKSATIEELEEVSYWVMSNDSVWDEFRPNFIEGLLWVYKNKEEK